MPFKGHINKVKEKTIPPHWFRDKGYFKNGITPLQSIKRPISPPIKSIRRDFPKWEDWEVSYSGKNRLQNREVTDITWKSVRLVGPLVNQAAS